MTSYTLLLKPIIITLRDITLEIFQVLLSGRYLADHNK